MSVHPVKVHDLGTTDAPGVKILVDRLWPRGIRKEDLGHDEWLKDVAPSPELRKWFGHEEERFAEFARRYREELDAGNEDVDKLRSLVREGDVTLLYAAKDREINHAVVLADWLGS
ncbi:DUF488 domain-containing protein [Corynebacterium sp. A21]|uniref:DUF488 domain-containing protein n=1 Tax=Corynebacterium sp. A21 TaxID=3457318 RepID=UPI003FD126FD